MALKLAIVKLAPSNSPVELKRVFESAVSDAHSRDHDALWYRTPIGRRLDRVSDATVGAEKRALSDAAQALAQLWRVSSNPR